MHAVTILSGFGGQGLLYAGQVLAFATHGAGPGTRDWIGTADFPRLWAQIARHFLPEALSRAHHHRIR